MNRADIVSRARSVIEESDDADQHAPLVRELVQLWAALVLENAGQDAGAYTVNGWNPDSPDWTFAQTFDTELEALRFASEMAGRYPRDRYSVVRQEDRS